MEYNRSLGRDKSDRCFSQFSCWHGDPAAASEKGAISEKQRRRLDEYFGSSDWYDALYREEKTLFEDKRVTKMQRSGERLVKWYREHLKTKFTFVSRAALICSTRKAHLYYLLVATHNKTGCKIANDIFLSAGQTV